MRRLAFSIRTSLIGAVLVTGILGATSFAAAQAADECPLPPLTLPLFAAATPADVAATPVVQADAPPMDEAGATEAMEVIVSCSNSGDPGVAYSIFTDRYLASLFANPDETYLPAFELQVEQGAAQPDRSLVLDTIESVTVLPDGRVEVVATTSTNGTTYTDTFILAWVDGAWLIDDVTSFDPVP